MTDWLVTVTETVGGGTVVRWFASEAAMVHVRPTVSASRRGVLGHEHLIGPDLYSRAHAAHMALTYAADVSGLATHVSDGPLSGRYLPVTP